MIILGIETACDDTAAAVVENGHNIRSNVVWTQKEVHARFGGVVPELAARRHAEVISYVIQEALDNASVSTEDIDAVGVNNQHGLLRSIVVGVAAAKAIAYSLQIPLIGIHHIEGHIYSSIIENPDIDFPHICLTVSGGHNLLVHVISPGRYELIGRTLDDAAGEAFDKVARLLGFGFPGGPIIDALSNDGNPKAFDFPRPLIDSDDYNFSFSGLKTAVLYTVRELKKDDNEPDEYKADIAASFQQAVIDVLVEKTLRAARKKQISTVTLAGGVAANNPLRTQLSQATKRENIELVLPSRPLCTDNGAVIAALAYQKLSRGIKSPMDLDARANAPIGELNLVY